LNHQSVNGEPANSTQRSSLRFGPCGLHYPPSSPRGHSIPLKFILVSPRFLLFLVPLSNGDQVPTSPCSLGNDPVRLRELLTDMNSRLVLLPAHPTQELNSKTSSVGFSFSFLRDIGGSDPGGVDELDHRGNAPIHLCLMLNRKDCLRVLLEVGNPDCRLQYVTHIPFNFTNHPSLPQKEPRGVVTND